MPAPSLRHLAVAALVCAVAVFGVLALRVRAGDDPALGAKAATAAPSPRQTDPFATGGEDDGGSAPRSGSGFDHGDDGAGGVPPASAAPPASSGVQPSAPTTRAS